MRAGQNPAKSIDYVKKPENITVAIITYIPFLSGYYQQSLEILKVCLNSLWENTRTPFDLMIFDNASCDEVKEYLKEMQDDGKIQFLTLSENNLGKGGGWNFIFNAAPGEYIAYADADIEFREGWLEKSIEIIDTYPKVGMVTGRPLRTPDKFSTAVIEWVKSNPSILVETGNLIDWDTYIEHTISCGVNEETSKDWYATTEDKIITYKEITAMVGAAHFQFVGKKKVFQSILPFKMDRPMGQVRQLDINLNDNNYLRLCLTSPKVKHLGNYLTSNTPINNKNNEFIKVFTKTKLIKKILLAIYNVIFNIYFKAGNSK